MDLAISPAVRIIGNMKPILTGRKVAPPLDSFFCLLGPFHRKKYEQNLHFVVEINLNDGVQQTRNTHTHTHDPLVAGWNFGCPWISCGPGEFDQGAGHE